MRGRELGGMGCRVCWGKEGEGLVPGVGGLGYARGWG